MKLVKDIVYFNSREGYIKKVYPMNKWIVISGKVSYFNKRYQITNPDYVTDLDNQDYVVKNIPKYNLTKGINEKKYRSISEQVITNIPNIDDWLDERFIEKNNLLNWNKSLYNLHNLKKAQSNLSKSYRRLVFDELCANFFTLLKNRHRIKRINFRNIFQNKIKYYYR